jgi:hypothetical protein
MATHHMLLPPGDFKNPKHLAGESPNERQVHCTKPT